MIGNFTLLDNPNLKVYTLPNLWGGWHMIRSEALNVIRLLFTAAVMIGSTVANADTNYKILIGATLIRGDGSPAVPDSVIIIEDDRILCAGDNNECPVAKGADVIDISGKYVTPGLIDSHVHFSQTGWLDGRPDSGVGQGSLYDYVTLQRELVQSLDRWQTAWLCTGITSVFDVGGHVWTREHPDILESSDHRVTAKTVGPLITYANVPALNQAEFEMFLPMGSDKEALESIQKLKAMGSDTVKVWYLNPSAAKKEVLDQRLMMIGQAVKAAGMDLIVHATELENAKLALKAGARLLVHSVEDKLVDQEFLDLLLANNAFYNPTLIVGRNWRRAVASAAFGIAPSVDDPNQCIDQKTINLLEDSTALKDTMAKGQTEPIRQFRRLENSGKKFEIMRNNLKAVYKAGGNIVVGTDSGNPLTMHGPSIYEEMEMMHKAEIPPADIIQMATSVGAELLGPEYEVGIIKKGMKADMLILKEDPQSDITAFRTISHVIKSGAMRKITHFAREP
jgi:imidazolonepropionase-like amidohydrolase